MNLNTTHRGAQGHVLAMVLVVVTICAIALMSYLQLVNAQNRVVARSQGWNATVPVMEAGVEEALAHLNANSETGLDVDGWVRIGDYYRMERSVGDNYYVVTITITNTGAPVTFPTIESRGFCRMPLLVQHNTSPFFLAQVGVTYNTVSYNTVSYNTPREGYVGRGVRITARKNGTLIKAMLAKGRINIGGDVVVDSYNSCDPTKSTGGLYDPAKAGDEGDIASNGQLVKEVTASGNVRIKGHISTGPGGTVGFTGQASAGSDSWVDGGRSGIEPGWFRDDMNATIADAPLPPPGGYTGLYSGGYVNGVYYDYILPAGVYNLSGLTLNSTKILVTGEVVLKVNGDIQMTGSGAIEIAPTARLEIYCSGANAALTANGIINRTGDPWNFTFYGAPTNTRVDLGGTSAFIGIVYAPYAELNVAGGAVIHGGTVSRSVKATGGFTLHYDECLEKQGQGRFVITSWDEMTPPEVAQVP